MFVTPDKESSMNTLWHEEEFEQICKRKPLTGKAVEIEKAISVKEHKRECHDFDPTMFYENRFLEAEAGWHSDQEESSNNIPPRVQTIISQK